MISPMPPAPPMAVQTDKQRPQSSGTYGWTTYGGRPRCTHVRGLGWPGLHNISPATFGSAFTAKIPPGPEPESPLWLEDVYSLVRREKIDPAIDLLFDRVDNLLLAGKFSECDALLKVIDVKRLDSNLIVAALSITDAAKDKLPSRSQFLDVCEKHLPTIAPGRVQLLLDGFR
jgi:hypothetical protein